MSNNKTWDEIYNGLKTTLEEAAESQQNRCENSVKDKQYESALQHILWWHDYRIRLNMLELINDEIHLNNTLPIVGNEIYVDKTIKDIINELEDENKKTQDMTKGVVDGDENIKDTIEDLLFIVHANNHTINILETLLNRLRLKENIEEEVE